MPVIAFGGPGPAFGMGQISLGQGGGGSGYPQFGHDAVFRLIGDSTDTSHYGASPGTGAVASLNGGYAAAAWAEKPRWVFEAWPTDTTSYQSGSTYGLGDRWIDGGPGAVPGAPIGYQEDRLAFSMSMSPDLYGGGLTVNTRDVPAAATRLIATFETAIANGCYVIAATMKPVEQGSTYDDANYRANHLPNNATLRAWAASKGPGKVLLIDWSLVMDPGLTGYCTVSGLLWDTIHPSDYGASVLADFWSQRLDLITAVGDDLFEWRWKNLTNHLQNPIFNSSDTALPLFSRTGAWASSSAGPRGFRGQGAGSTASTVITTLEANPETGGNSIVFPIVTSATSIASEGFQFMPRPNASYTNGFVPAPELAGKWVSFAVEIEVPEGPYFASPQASIADDYANTTKYSRLMDVASAGIGSNNRRRSKAQRFKMMTDPCKLDDLSGGPRCSATVKVLGLAAYSAGITNLGGSKIHRAALWDVDDPKKRYNLA